MIDFKHIGDIERTMLGTACLLHELCIDVPGRRHDHYYVLSFLIEEESDIPDFGTWEKEIERWAQGIHGEIVNLWGELRKESTIKKLNSLFFFHSTNRQKLRAGDAYYMLQLIFLLFELFGFAFSCSTTNLHFQFISNYEYNSSACNSADIQTEIDNHQ